MRKGGLDVETRLRRIFFSSSLRYAIITIQSISKYYYTALYCRSKHNVLLSQENFPPLLITPLASPFTRFIKSLDYA